MHKQIRRVGFLLLLTGTPLLGGQSQAEVNRRLDLVLEKKEGNGVKAVSAEFVFTTGDKIRFRFRSAVNGYLYVMDQGSSGKWTQLYPRDELTQSRRVAAGKDYLVPASGSGWFEVTGPAGYDNVYFLISPMDLGKTLPAASRPQEDESESQTAAAAAFATATPRCDDDLFRARGECLDTNAGLKPLGKDEKLPEKLSQLPSQTSRDLIVVDNAKDTTVSSTEP
ncbi:MAG TPA: DUF4384 domain-containing protein, partial [Bryobacteraceae bacterium]|nr:DUF4384 domain-containing protein [Bryobacteraceae bacterium]